jgi:hypothetical protein
MAATTIPPRTNWFAPYWRASVGRREPRRSAKTRFRRTYCAGCWARCLGISARRATGPLSWSVSPGPFAVRNSCVCAWKICVSARRVSPSPFRNRKPIRREKGKRSGFRTDRTQRAVPCGLSAPGSNDPQSPRGFYFRRWDGGAGKPAIPRSPTTNWPRSSSAWPVRLVSTRRSSPDTRSAPGSPPRPPKGGASERSIMEQTRHRSLKQVLQIHPPRQPLPGQCLRAKRFVIAPPP